MNRDEWLDSAVKEIRKIFKAAGFDLPKIRILVGFPGGGLKSTNDAECWPREYTTDGANVIVLSPSLTRRMDVLEALTHELVHAYDDCVSDHTAAFRDVASAVGMEAPYTQSWAGRELRKALRDVSRKLGRYPSPKFTAMDHHYVTKPTGQLPWKCTKDGYTIRVSKKWSDQGTPICGMCGGLMKRA